jgi:hypothetical protein
MSINFYEAELRKNLVSDFRSGRLNELGDSALFFKQLAKEFPVKGSKIHWGRVPHSIERSEKQLNLHTQQFIKFVDELIIKFGLKGDVIYVGDSATDFALGGSVISVRTALPELLTVPQHHYLIAKDFAWCICLTMEGDMAFGLNPRSPQ